MSTTDVSYIGIQRNWTIPTNFIEQEFEETEYPSVTEGTGATTISLSSQSIQKIFDPKSGLQIYVLNVPKDAKAIKQTAGILARFEKRLAEEHVEPVDLVKRAWKTSEPNDK